MWLRSTTYTFVTWVKTLSLRFQVSQPFWKTKIKFKSAWCPHQWSKSTSLQAWWSVNCKCQRPGRTASWYWSTWHTVRLTPIFTSLKFCKRCPQCCSTSMKALPMLLGSSPIFWVRQAPKKSHIFKKVNSYKRLFNTWVMTSLTSWQQPEYSCRKSVTPLKSSWKMSNN